MATLTIFGKTFILKKNPWTHPKMAAILKRVQKAPKTEYVLATPPPWFGKNLEAMTRKQVERLKLFSEVSHDTRGMPLRERIPIIAERLRTGRAPRPSKAKKTEDTFHVKVYPRLIEVIERKEKVAPTATPGV